MKFLFIFCLECVGFCFVLFDLVLKLLCGFPPYITAWCVFPLFCSIFLFEKIPSVLILDGNYKGVVCGLGMLLLSLCLRPSLIWGLLDPS